MKKFLSKVLDTLNQGCTKIIEKPRKIWLVVLWITFFVFLGTQRDDLITLENEVNIQNQELREQAVKIVEEKEFDIDLTENLTSYKVEELENYYYVYLNGKDMNYVKLTLDKEFKLVNQSTVSNLWIVVVLVFVLMFVVIYATIMAVALIILIITEKIKDIKHKKSLKEKKENNT